MKRALIVIDVQNEYFTGMLPITYPENSLAKITKAMDAAASKGIPIVVVQHTDPSENAAAYKKGTPEWEFHQEITKRHFDHLVEKNFPGSFTGTDLESWLRQNGVDTVTIAGYMTHICCDTTARQAFHHGYKVEFLSDATGTLSLTNDGGSVTGEEMQRAILVAQSMFFSKVLTTDDWVESL
ncbi:MAG TPA: cysteine hydrolase family protein [Syntrophomonadaceae bacterium]|nr:cysteine hydrolase family protein [Syntrophomonadaceae bacterium]